MNMRTLIHNRRDILKLRDFYKKTAKKKGIRVGDLLALSPNNDIAYVRPSDLSHAKWFAKVWEAEGGPEIHPRGFHYMILGKGYKTDIGADYLNTNACWEVMKDGAFWAQVLGLVPADKIKDEKNPAATLTSHIFLDSPYRPIDKELESGYESGYIPSGGSLPELSYDSTENLIEGQVTRIVNEVFAGVSYNVQRRQKYYIEIWSEKAGVIDEEIAEKYGATIRAAGGGEMSYKMVRDAVGEAKQRGQDLVVILIVDFDPKGHDMPKSVARKIEVEAALMGVHAYVHHAAVTLEQVKEHGIPGTPAKKPKGLESRNPGALAYETHKKIFREFAGQDPVEIRAFSSREPEAYAAALEEHLKPYYDEDLADKIQGVIRDAKVSAESALRDELEANRGDIDKALSAVRKALGNYESQLGGSFDCIETNLSELAEQEEMTRKETGLDAKVRKLEKVLNAVDVGGALSLVEICIPEADADGQPNPLLDTKRSLEEQIRKYKEFDIRCSKRGEHLPKEDEGEN